MSYRVKIYNLWQNKSLLFKSSLGLGLLLAFLGIMALTGYLSLRYVGIANNTITTSSEIQRLVLEMDGGMAKARNLHGKFFLYYPRIGLRQAHEKYAQPSIRQTAQVVAISKLLQETMDNPEVSDAIIKSRIDINLYLSSAKRFADTSIESFELVTRLVTPEKGLYDRLDALLSQLNTVFLDTPELFHQMAWFVKTYQVTHERFLMQSAFNVAFELQQSVDSDPLLEEPQKQEIKTLLNQFKDIAEEIVTVDVGIGAKFNDFQLQEKITSTISENLVALAEKEVVKSRESIAATQKHANRLLLCVTLFGLIAAIIIFRFMTVHITQRILQLTKSARTFRKDHFEIVPVQGGNDEIGQLGHTFNFMAMRIKELVEGLEETVNQRTQALTISENRFHELFEHANSGMAIFEAIDQGNDFIFKEINHSMEKILDVQAESLVGKRISLLFPVMVENGFIKTLKGVWHSGKAIEHPVSSYDKEQLLFWHENKIYKLPGGDIVTICNDTTIAKQAEIHKKVMEHQLRQAKKMEAIGLLAGGVAHDLNNVLTPIVGYSELFLADLPEQSTLRGASTAIHESGKRATAIVADLLTVAPGVAKTKENCDLNDLVTCLLNEPETEELMGLHQEIEYQILLKPTLRTIPCSPVHIKKCVTNLLNNAVAAIDGAGTITLATSNCTMDKEESLKKGVPTGNYVMMRVSDTGPEISQKDLEHIFEPFYVKKVMGRIGTGLGLAVTWNIMEEHGGTIQVESEPHGTSFYLYLPATEKSSPQSETPTTVTSDLMGRGEHILVVDDDSAVRLFAKTILTRFGYDVVCVSSGEEALEYVAQHSVELVLLDMLMDPGINGRQTYERMMKINPGQRAVIASGFSDSEDIEKTLQLGAVGFIKKPYSIDGLARIVKARLAP